VSVAIVDVANTEYWRVVGLRYLPTVGTCTVAIKALHNYTATVGESQPAWVHGCALAVIQLQLFTNSGFPSKL